MKISRIQLRKLINEAVNEASADNPRGSAMAAAIANIEKQYGKGSVIDSAAPDKVSNDWMQLVMRNSRYQETLLHVWEHLTDGDDPAATKELYLNDLDNNDSIAGAITFYGRRIKKGAQYLTSAQMREKIKTIKVEKEEARKNAPPKPWRRPKYGMGTRIDPETGEEIQWTGTHERFN